MYKKLLLSFFTFMLGIQTKHSSTISEKPSTKATTAYVFSDTNVLSSIQSPSKKQLITLAARVAVRHPLLAAKALWIKKDIEKYVAQHPKEDNLYETKNIIHEVIDLFGLHGLEKYADQILAIIITPKPNTAIIEEIKALKEQVPPPPIFLATNQDRKQFKQYLAKLDQQGVPVNELFDGYLTTYCSLEEDSPEKTSELDRYFATYCSPHNIQSQTTIQYVEFTDGSAMICSANVTKQQASFFQALARYIQNRFSETKTIIYTDCDTKNLEAAHNAGIAVAAFEISIENKKLHEYPQEEIKGVIEKWKKSLSRIMLQQKVKMESKSVY